MTHQLVPLFLYGTLRSGGTAHHLIRPHLTGPHIPGTVNGTLHHSPHGDWPILILDEHTGATHGDLVWVHPTTTLWDLLGNYEVAAGYDLRWTPFTPQHAGETSTTLVCAWPRNNNVGAVIQSGDWLLETGAKNTSLRR